MPFISNTHTNAMFVCLFKVLYATVVMNYISITILISYLERKARNAHFAVFLDVWKLFAKQPLV